MEKEREKKKETKKKEKQRGKDVGKKTELNTLNRLITNIGKELSSMIIFKGRKINNKGKDDPSYFLK